MKKANPLAMAYAGLATLASGAAAHAEARYIPSPTKPQNVAAEMAKMKKDYGAGALRRHCAENPTLFAAGVSTAYVSQTGILNAAEGYALGGAICDAVNQLDTLDRTDPLTGPDGAPLQRLDTLVDFLVTQYYAPVPEGHQGFPGRINNGIGTQELALTAIALGNMGYKAPPGHLQTLGNAMDAFHDKFPLDKALVSQILSGQHPQVNPTQFKKFIADQARLQAAEHARANPAGQPRRHQKAAPAEPPAMGGWDTTVSKGR